MILQAMSYRSGHHSTSDDSARYRTRDEMQRWKARDPVMRFQRWLTANQWWDEEREQDIRRTTRKEVWKPSFLWHYVPPLSLSVSPCVSV
jgi:2-oxoisovalerate dehydrogenase E1 component alpha subunit